MMEYMMQNYSEHALSLDVSTDNVKALKFYRRVGLKIQKLYMSAEKVEFALFETPLDKNGNRIEENSRVQ